MRRGISKRALKKNCNEDALTKLHWDVKSLAKAGRIVIVLVSPGSEVTVMKRSLAKELGLILRRHSPVTLEGYGNTKTQKSLDSQISQRCRSVSRLFNKFEHLDCPRQATVQISNTGPKHHAWRRLNIAILYNA